MRSSTTSLCLRILAGVAMLTLTPTFTLAGVMDPPEFPQTEIQTIAVTAHTADREVRYPSTLVNVNNDQISIGYSQTDVPSLGVFPFQIPELPDLPDPILSASLSISYHSRTSQTPFYIADLYGLPFRTGSGVQTQDIWFGAYGGILPENGDPNVFTAFEDSVYGLPAGPLPQGFHPIQQGLITLDTAHGRLTTDPSEASDNLAAYLNAQIAAGAQPGDYVFLLLTHDSPTVTGGFSSYRVRSANYTDAEERPVLSMTVIPEPGTYAAFLSGFLFVFVLLLRLRTRSVRA